MSQEPQVSQDQSSANDNSTEIELQPRATTQADLPEEHNDTERLERSKVDICNGQTSAPQNSAPDRPPSLEQISHQATDTLVPGDDSTNHNVICENVHVDPLDERILLNKVRDEFLLKLSATTEGAGGISTSGDGPKTISGPGNGEIIELFPGRKAGVYEGSEAARVERLIRDSWPLSRDVEGSKLPGHQLEEQVEEIKKPADRLLFLISEKRKMPHMKAHGVIGATQPETGGKPCRSTFDDKNCLLSKRQTATIRQGLEKVCLQEKRARISFRVLKQAQKIFGILVLTDEETFPDTYDPDEEYSALRSWSRHGLQDRMHNDITPLTHYLFEICRVFKICMDAWGETLGIIDELVHFKLDDFDNVLRVEDLMFDKSFQRSKDYFVALQLLRIVDEWLDEVQSSVEDMVKSLNRTYTFPYDISSKDCYDGAVRYVNEHTTAAQSRVRKKREEINSLRDGLFNATSLRESTKAMALNQAIYVFTVVTVLFTPVSFLATFWALPFLNNPTEGVVPVPSAFRNSFNIMPLLTYALVIVVAWFVGQRNSVNRLLTMLGKLRESTGQLLRSGWNLLRKKPEKGNGRSPYL
ncbi:hypothetical protein Focb16_v016424 [Fusarium oxysporum f. sp. cubense]|uniref:Uncharacterized protein n=1 Tax=Fusarium oxysporum f. sp. cubense TaxID=61366 RepID=A0A559KXJ2_FUSOC|nr:hypothetical protein Focb16_v016424 [Fusarium oxysporum f. sp. cubense]